MNTDELCKKIQEDAINKTKDKWLKASDRFLNESGLCSIYMNFSFTVPTSKAGEEHEAITVRMTGEQLMQKLREAGLKARKDTISTTAVKQFLSEFKQFKDHIERLDDMVQPQSD